MELIQQLQINNYKSINQINLSCSRINVLVGRPNVGKSNILEALDLMYLSSFLNTNSFNEKTGIDKIDCKEYFRVGKVADLFHLGDTSKTISVKYAGFSYDFDIRFNNEPDSNGLPKNIFEWIKSNGQNTTFNNDFEPLGNTHYYGSPIHPYKYKKNVKFRESSYLDILMPPFGENLPEFIQHNSSFRNFIGDLAKDHGFEFNIDATSNGLLIQLRVNKGLVHTLPYEALSETLKRFIFYIAAIRHNNAHVVTLEEPEVHSFPPFVSFLADEIIRTEKRQFFIATHSPYLLNNLIENSPSQELSVFVCGYDKNNLETTVKKLSQEELSELLNFGVDIFFNINRYEADRVKYNS